MEAFLTYTAKSILSMFVFYMVYRFLMKNDTFFRLSRYYLLLAFVASLILPMADFSNLLDTQEAAPIVFYTMDAITVGAESVQVVAEENVSALTYVLYGYICVSALLLLRLIIRVGRVAYLAGKARKREINKARVFELDSNHSPFSFFNLIFISGDSLDIDELDKIIQHERVHARQFHTLDLLLLEMAAVVFWINPMIGIYRKSLQEVHEFIADDEVCRAGSDALDYKQLMVRQLTGISLDSPANCFNSIKIRRRFGMITKTKTSKAALLKLLAIIPISAFILFIYACADNIDQLEAFTFSDEDVEIPVAMFDRLEAKQMMYDNMKLPQAAIENNYTGKAVVRYDIDEEGNVVNPRVVNGCDLDGKWTRKGLKYGCNEEAERLVGMMPKWKPAMKDGQPVRFTQIETIILGDKDAWMREHRLSYYNEKVNKEIKESDIVPAYYPGGDEALWKYIQENVKYPEEARKKGIEGTVIIDVGIDKEGNVGTMQYISSKGNELLIGAATEVLRNMPKWKPAIYKVTGEPIEYYVKVPIHFRLKDKKAEKWDEKYILEDDGEKLNPEDIYPATYPGGKEAMLKFIQENIKYPEEARKKGLEAEFSMAFLINAKGEPEVSDNFENVDEIFENEAIRVVELMRWRPAYVRRTGKTAMQMIEIPFSFKLSNDK